MPVTIRWLSHWFCSVADFSLCSRKCQIVLGLKQIDWTPHCLNLQSNEHRTEYYRGINPLGVFIVMPASPLVIAPSGVVPCLVHDGVVINESNDICMYLEEHFPNPTLVPKDNAVKSYLAENDAYHMDVRNLTFRYILPRTAMSMVIAKAKKDVLTMQGEHKHLNEKLIANNGITDA